MDVKFEDMKKAIFTLFVLFSTAYAVFAGSRADTLKVMSYNLRFGELASMKQIGEYIAGESPDLVALQECDWDTRRTRAPHQHGVKFVNELAYWSGMFGLYGKSINYAGGYYGIGLLSRYPILRSERVLLPNDGKTEQRSMLIADIELPSGRILTFVCTHLEVKTSKMRQEQVRFINKYLKGVRNQIILCGDMNAEPSSEEMMMLAKDWANLTDTQLTYSTMKPQTKIDYIWSKPSSKVVLLSTRVCKDVKLSDHFPVLSEIVIK